MKFKLPVIKDYTLILIIGIIIFAALFSCNTPHPTNYKAIDLPEEIGEVSKDSAAPTVLTAYKLHDTVFIQFKNY